MTYDPKIRSLRVTVKSAYALQKLRMQTGLRLCANLRAKLKGTVGDDGLLDPETEELSADAQKLIAELYVVYKRLTDGVAKRRTLPRERGFVGESIISDFAELVIAHTYFEILRQEREQFRLLGEVLDTLPIYVHWLKPQEGIGPAMAGILVTYFDIHKADYPSKFWAFSGLDVGPPINGVSMARSRRKEHLVER